MDDLRQIGQLDLWAKPDTAAVRVGFIHDHFDESGFTRAVVTDEGKAFSALYL